MEFVKAPRSIRITGETKVHTGMCTIVNSSPDYKKFDVRVNQDCIDRWRLIEERAKGYVDCEWSSLLYDDIFRVKYDDDSMFFNQQKEIIDPVIRIGSRCMMIFECVSVYTFNKKSGISVRIHQCLMLDPECVL